MFGGTFFVLILNKQKKHHKGAFCLLEQATGIEPASQAWEARVLPLNYACIACRKLIYKFQLILQVNFYNDIHNFVSSKI